ncbi:MAG TPA: glutathione S-transferase family protein [Quisquiliibacterium sp.]|nr:glutathione S-transferase family protein [Quisquiliibacterium sp.]
MPELILHHYPASPFAEKIRLMLGAKSLAWRSVEIPMVMPKPDLMPLTGGYRRTPVLQVGADVYCDTALIARVIERLHPTPPLASDLTAMSDFALAQVADTQLFSAAVAYAMQPEGLKTMFAGMTPEQMSHFAEDRRKMREGGSAARMPLPEASGVLLGLLARIDGQLADGRRFLTGDAARVCDFSCYHPLWFIRRAGSLASIFEPYPHLRGWMGRVEAFGHGSPQPMPAGEALDVARAATPGMLPGRSLREVDGVGVGDEVSVSAVDYGVDPVMGTLVDADVDSFALRRSDPRIGDVVVHFPRIGFRIRKA